MTPSASAQELVGEACRLAAAERLDEAVDCFRAALRLEPDRPNVLAALGKVLQIQRRMDDAGACFGRALELEPGNPWLHFYLGAFLLLNGRFDRCWAELEWFWLTGHLQAAAQALGAPRWDGTPLAGRTILLEAPLGGFGDNLMWIRYLPYMASRGGRIVLRCPAELARLFGQLGAVDLVVPLGQPLPPFDVHAPLMSLAHLLAMPDPAQTAVPYLRPPDEDAARWAQLLPPRRGPRVGLVWAVDPSHPAGPRRSISLAELEPLAGVGGVSFFSLQRGPGAEELRTAPFGTRLAEIGPSLRDFADTAGLLSQLDLVITVDTAVAHLAGALGMPVWILLASQADARWLLDREDCPWYPSARLFRQRHAWDWRPVAERLAAELAGLSPG
jgi:hypothetical protein